MPIPTCPANCTTELAETNFNECAPAINLSEIVRIFIALASATPFTDVAQASEWTTRLSQTATDVDAIRALTVIADKPAGTAVTRDISGGRTYIIGKDHTLNVSIDDTSDENYEFIRKLECGGKFKIWYETAGGYLYGGNEGIPTKSVNFDDVLNRGADEIETFEGTITWRAKFHPERVKSPIFGTVVEAEDEVVGG